MHFTFHTCCYSLNKLPLIHTCTTLLSYLLLFLVSSQPKLPCVVTGIFFKCNSLILFSIEKSLLGASVIHNTQVSSLCRIKHQHSFLPYPDTRGEYLSFKQSCPFLQLLLSLYFLFCFPYFHLSKSYLLLGFFFGLFSFFFFKLWKWDNTFTGYLENIEQSYI